MEKSGVLFDMFHHFSSVKLGITGESGEIYM